MRPAYKALFLLVLLILGAIWSQWERHLPADNRPATSAAPTKTNAAGFDYYLIALSWSPSWCESHPEDREQCGQRGYGFILHGLWPQFERGGGPSNCTFDRGPDRTTIGRTQAFMPSRDLIEHEWRAHGSCSGLDPEAYFALADRAFAAVRIPDALSAGSRPTAMTADQLRSAFLRTDTRLRSDMLAITCKSDKLAEVRICVDGNLEPRTCGRGVRMQCPRNSPLRIPWSR